MSLRLFVSLAALTLVACQPSADASSPPSATTRAAPHPSPSPPPEAPATAAPASAAAQPTTEPSAIPDPAPSSPEGIARTLLTEGGITYSASKKKFLYELSWNEEGNGAGRRIEILGDDGKREAIDVCAPSECEQKAAELPEALGPTIAARVRDGGYTLVTPVSWPSGKAEMELPGLSAKLRFNKDHIEIVVANAKKATALAKLKFSSPHKPSPEYVAVSTDKSLFAVGYGFDPGSKYGEGFNLYSEVHVYRVP